MSKTRIGSVAAVVLLALGCSHPSRGCSQDNLRASGGAGLIYCFATN